MNVQSAVVPQVSSADLQLQHPAALSDEQLVTEIERFNAAYRAGTPLVSDEEYDHVYLTELRTRLPSHPLLTSVDAEPEGVLGAPVRHAAPMLSTMKAYQQSEVDGWIARVAKAAAALGLAPEQVQLRLTPKLDGIAGHWDGAVLATRGDGLFGQDVTRCLVRGVQIDRGLEGAGELVIEDQFFEANIAQQYDMDHPRNFMAGLLGADTLKPHHDSALDAGVCRFVSYQSIASIEMPLTDLASRWAESFGALCNSCIYRTDGVVVEVLNAALRDALGTTSHHPRWNLALKQRGETAVTEVEGVELSVGRTGRITPVILCAGVRLSGAMIRRCTAHTARHLTRLGIGPGAQIRICRSGEVIPKIEAVLRPAEVTVDLNHCPCCGAQTQWDNDYLVCPNSTGCAAQASAKLEHFFLRMGIKGFGPVICEQLAAGGVTDPVAVVEMDAAWFERLGISPGVARNLVAAIWQRKGEIVRDADAVAALGVRHFGRGDARKALEVHPWQSFGSLTAASLEAIPGFGAQTASAIAPFLPMVVEKLVQLVAAGFTLEATVRPADVAASPVKGLKLVFTGTMPVGRAEMEQQARELGATVQSGVSATTDMLVIGDKAGSKLAKAQQLGVRVVPVAEYLAMLSA